MASLVLITETIKSWPVAVAAASSRAKFSILQFFAAEIANEHTKRAYLRAAEDFFIAAATMPGGDRLESIMSLHVAAWLDLMETQGLSSPTIKLRLAAVRALFQALVRDQVLPTDPTVVVRGPKHSVTSGKTPMLDSEDMRKLLASIDTSTLIGLRDHAMIATMAYSFARVSAVTGLEVGNLFHQKQRLWLRLAEKGGKIKDVPCHPRLHDALTAWLSAVGHVDTPTAPLFQSFVWEEAVEVNAEARETPPAKRKRTISGRPMTQARTWEMVQRRARHAGIRTRICNHTFRAAGITSFLSNGGTIERAAHIAGHASINTTKLYDRRPDDVTIDEIDKVRF